MALLEMQGFDVTVMGSGELDYLPGWLGSGTSNPDLVAVYGRRAGAAMSLINTGRAEYNIGSEKTTLFLCFALRAAQPAGVPGTPCTYLVSFNNAAALCQCCLDRTAAHRLRLLAAPGGAVLAQSADGVLVPGIYYYLEVKIVCGAAGSIDVKIDGVNVLSGAGINTRQQGAGGVQKLVHAPYTEGLTYTTYIDDWYLLDDTGPAPYNTWFGDKKIEGILPAVDGFYEQWTPSTGVDSAACIKDTGSSTWDDKWVSTDVLNEKDSFTLVPVGTWPLVYVVEARSYWRNYQTGQAGLKHILRISGTDYYGAEALHGDTNEWQMDRWDQNPDTAADWTLADIQAMQYGFELTAQIP
jgi:hypothetical protein